MKASVWPGLLAFLCLSTATSAQIPSASPANRLGQDSSGRLSRVPQVVPTCSVRRTCITNPVFATGMKCDGVSDDSSALQSSLNAAQTTLGNATVIMPPGTCVVDPAANITIGSSLWLQGAGRNGTTLKRKDSSAGGFILKIAADGVTLSDFSIDGNKGGPGVATAADSVTAAAPSDQVTIQRMRFLNATGSDITSPAAATGVYISNWLISDNEFENQGLTACGSAAICANILIDQPLGLRVVGNRSDASQHFAIFGSVSGGGLVEVGDNTVANVNGYGVSLGAGSGSAGANVHHNFISTTKADLRNLIDLAAWNDFTVDHNILYHNGEVVTAVGAFTGCIVAFSPGIDGVIDGNECYAVPTSSITVNGIAVGGSNITISNNHVRGCSAAGIAIIVDSQGPQRDIKIIGNSTKNNSTQVAGAHAGIELLLPPGPSNAPALSDVLIQNNHSYDDQPAKTQGYGIGIGLAGANSNFSNIIVEGNDVAGNLKGGIESTGAVQGFVVRNNFGFNPIGTIAPPDFPGPGDGPITNTTGYDVMVYITAGANPISIAINGITLKGVRIPAGKAGAPIRLAANQNITLTYTAGGTPSWQWIGD